MIGSASLIAKIATVISLLACTLLACRRKYRKVSKEIDKAPAEVVKKKTPPPPRRVASLISIRADNIIYNRFRELLPNINIENMEEENTDDDRKCWVRLMSVVTPFINVQPNRPVPYRINALSDFSDENASLTCYAIAVIIEIARRKEISGYKPMKIVY